MRAAFRRGLRGSNALGGGAPGSVTVRFVEEAQREFLDAISTPKRTVGSLCRMSQTLQYLTDEHGDRTAVVLPISDYEKLLEDLDDLAVVAERRDEPVISHDAFVADLKRDGTL